MSVDLFEPQATHDEQDGGEAGPAHLQPAPVVSQLTKHWNAAVDEFASSGCDAMRNRNVTKELLALGAIRTVYWLALGQGDVTLAKEIAEWWADCEPLHGLGEVIR